MRKLLTILVLAFPLVGLAALTVNNGGGPTNITSTSAWLRVSVTAVGDANPTVYAFWGTNDASTNLTWAYTNDFGVCTVATYSVQAISLTKDTLYYYRAYATNTTETAWASYSMQFRTLGSGTTAPPSSVQAVTVDTNDVLKHPGTNFWYINRAAIVAGIGSLTNEPAFTNWLDTNTYVQSNSGSWAGTWQGLGTNALATAAQGELADSAVQPTDSDYTNTAALAAGALQSGADGTSTNLSAYNNDAGFITSASGVTNQIMDVDGVLYTITNAPLGGYILEFDPANNTAWFVAKSSTGTFDHTALSNFNGMADVQHLTAAEKAIAANAFQKNGGTLSGGMTNIYGYGMGTNLITMFGGVLNGTNGVYWTCGTNDYWILFQ